MKGVLLEVGGPIQPFREKEVKFDGATVVANDKVPAIPGSFSLCGVDQIGMATIGIAPQGEDMRKRNVQMNVLVAPIRMD
ncbi:MAG: hypothetical protein K0S58_3341 [Nitrospira sp.]|jgi:hypothetical protein|nr:hypothetical protein [Nitrospira sp.]